MKAPFFTTGEYEEKTMGRRELRESIFRLLFMTEFNDNQEMAEQKQLYLETIEDIQEKDQSYIQEKYEKIREKLPEIDAALNEASKGWKTSRMGKVELLSCVWQSMNCVMMMMYPEKWQSTKR